ncbi:putative O-glycosylation ligase, exosortase A system-associated [Bowmanella pacifica]|uniref:O-antigen polymerase n=1 Tax=Bowmanella pacifica TaxID=502051 RepID=A0A917YQC7_9ALTE|nr:putative O-glycosylation ligase, exosortase A system-associated [Bowmanella pacifica]GGO63788.1 O-antigen polymerase [Bowmanella pacifica]
MRDIFFVGFLIYAIYFTFKRPYIGVAAWIWIALTAPSQWAFGFSQSLRLNLTIVLVTALAYMFYRDKPKFVFTKLHFWVFAFWFWMLISSIFSLRIDDAYTWEKMIEFTKVVALFLFITMTVRRTHEVDTLIWAMVLSISAYAGMEALKFLISGGGHRIVGRAGIIIDRNDLAVAINMCIPFVVYLWAKTEHKMLKLGLLGLLLLNVLAIIGTYSRGGFIGLCVLAIAFWLKSQRKILFLILALILLPIGYGHAPEEWKERQQTVETAATEDGSFIGRLWAWKIATLIALDNPMTGGGFKATTDPVLWATYAPDTPYFGPIETPPIPPELIPKAAHNIYFQVMASAGFVGLFLFCCMLLSSLLQSLRNRIGSHSLKKGLNLESAIVLSLVGYGITGLNVSLAYFDLLYAIIGVIAVVGIQKKQAETAPSGWAGRQNQRW